jgi:hypothetical protein
MWTWLWLACGTAPPAGGPTDLGPGTVLADGFDAQRTGTADSTMGLLKARDGHLVVNYDIGGMAGTRAYDDMTGCGSFETLDAGGVPAFVCVTGSDVVVTVGAPIHAGSHFPANFWATADDEAERDEVIRIATSYRPAGPTETKLLWIPRGIGVVTDAGGSRHELTMEADPTAVEVTTGATLGHTSTWSTVGNGVRAEVLTRRVCGAQLQSDPGPPDSGETYVVDVVVFETKVPCTHPWDPETDGYRELHRATIE